MSSQDIQAMHPTLDELKQAIEEAEVAHIAAGMVVDLRYDDLEEALRAQKITRNDLMALRAAKMQREAAK